MKTISTSSWCGFETDSRSRGTVASSTPCSVPMATWALRGSVATSRVIGRPISWASVAATAAAVKSKGARVTPGATRPSGRKPTRSASGRAVALTRAAAASGVPAASASATAKASSCAIVRVI